jgi:hypothetical protein
LKPLLLVVLILSPITEDEDLVPTAMAVYHLPSLELIKIKTCSSLRLRLESLSPTDHIIWFDFENSFNGFEFGGGDEFYADQQESNNITNGESMEERVRREHDEGFAQRNDQIPFRRVSATFSSAYTSRAIDEYHLETRRNHPHKSNYETTMKENDVLMLWRASLLR